MTDVLGMLVFFGSIATIIVSLLRYRYRVQLLAAAMQHPGLLHGAPRQSGESAGAEVEARVEALEEKLAWLERLVESGDRARLTRVAADSLSTPAATHREVLAFDPGRTEAALPR
jgi:hypothetical protein